MEHKQEKSSMLGQGVFIFVYLAVLTVLEFGIAITFNSTVLLVVIALVKAALVVYYYMHIYKLNAEHEGDEDSYEYKSGTNRVGIWLFLVSDSFVFGGLMAMRINLLGLAHPNLNQFLGLVVTAVLLVSSFFMNRGETLMASGDRKGFITNTFLTFVLGLGFLIVVVFVEWPNAIREGITPSGGAAGAWFFFFTGMRVFPPLFCFFFLLFF